MVVEYYIINSAVKELNPVFNSFNGWLDLRLAVGKVFNDENCKWSISGSFNDSFVAAYYKTETSILSLEIMSLDKTRNFCFKITALGGTHPLLEIARLCQLNNWNAYKIDDTYLDLTTPPILKISDKDREIYYQKRDDLINGVSSSPPMATSEKPAKKFWWKFW